MAWSHAWKPWLLSILHPAKEGLHRCIQAKQQLSTAQQQVSSLRGQLSSVQQEVSILRTRLSSEQQRVSSLEQELATGHGDTAWLRRELDTARLDAMQADQEAVVTLRRELHTARLHADDLQAQLDTKQRELSTVQAALKSEQATVSSLRREVSIGQQHVDSGQSESGHHAKITRLDASRPRVPTRSERALAEQIRQAMLDEPGISGRAIAAKVTCSPTTANRWKTFFEEGGQLPDVVNE